MLLTSLLDDFAPPGNAVTGASDKPESQNFYPLQFCIGTRILMKILQVQTQNHYMVIITIPKFFLKVNDFQKSFNNLLMLNNTPNLKLGNVTTARNIAFFDSFGEETRNFVKQFFFTFSCIFAIFG